MQLNGIVHNYSRKVFPGHMDTVIYHTFPMEHVVTDVKQMSERERGKMVKNMARAARRNNRNNG